MMAMEHRLHFSFVLTDGYRDADVQKYKELTEAMKVLLSKYKKMELQLEAYEKTHGEMEEQAR
jgi:hypothetical protein